MHDTVQGELPDRNHWNIAVTASTCYLIQGFQENEGSEPVYAMCKSFTFNVIQYDAHAVEGSAGSDPLLRGFIAPRNVRIHTCSRGRTRRPKREGRQGQRSFSSWSLSNSLSL